MKKPLQQNGKHHCFMTCKTLGWCFPSVSDQKRDLPGVERVVLTGTSETNRLFPAHRPRPLWGRHAKRTAGLARRAASSTPTAGRPSWIIRSSCATFPIASTASATRSPPRDPPRRARGTGVGVGQGVERWFAVEGRGVGCPKRQSLYIYK